MNICRKMDGLYEHFKNTEFKPTIVNMKDQSTVNLYFGNSKSIKFTDNYGRYHECTYYEALNFMMNNLKDKNENLSQVQTLIGDKLRKTEANQNYNDLNNPSKHRINTTMSQISKVVSIIGNFIKYIMADINTINKSVDKILGKTTQTKPKNVKPDKVNTKL